MPQIGDTTRGKDMGKSYNSKFVWLACMNCGKQRWTQYNSRHLAQICRVCAQIADRERIRALGKRKRTPEEIQRLRDTQVLVQNAYRFKQGEQHPLWKGNYPLASPILQLPTYLHYTLSTLGREIVGEAWGSRHLAFSYRALSQVYWRFSQSLLGGYCL